MFSVAIDRARQIVREVVGDYGIEPVAAADED
jgi:hypothetical protein